METVLLHRVYQPGIEEGVHVQIEVNGIHLWFDVDGPALVPDGAAMRNRRTVVLLHGGPGSFDHSYFKPDFGRLARVAQVVYLDLRGHGRSHHGDPEAWSFEACADDLPAFCDALGIEKPVVLGHSLGGFVAMLYGARHPGHAGGLVLLSTTARFDVPRMVENFRRVAGDEIADVIRRAYTEERDSVLPEEWSRAWKFFGPWVTGPEEKSRIVMNPPLNPPGMELLRQFDAVDQLRRIQSPTLVSVGELDPVTCVASAREIMAALPAGLAHLEIIEGAGHFPWRDAPERYWQVLEHFLEETAEVSESGTPRHASARPHGPA
jgi:pimeloyl-ACP methyl ester carboxylesterase